MVYRNKKTTLVICFFALIGFLYFSYNIKEIEWKMFSLFFDVWLLFCYISALFEYYKVNDKKIVYRSRLKKHEVFWKDICRVYITDTGLFKEIRVDYGFLGENNILISSIIKEYKELVKTIIRNTEDNPDVSIDIRLDDFLNS